MKIRIFQPKNSSEFRDMNLAYHKAHGGIDEGEYMQVYGGTTEEKNLMELFNRLNTSDYPPGYVGRRMSIGDVAEICEGENRGTYFADTEGFVKIDFDISKTDHEDMMKVLVLENEKEPYEAEIRKDIHAMQSVVDGPIEPVYFEPECDAVCWCNDEFLLRGDFLPNRIIGNTVVHGTCFITGDGYNSFGERDSCSLTDEQIEKYKEQFAGYFISGVCLPEENEEISIVIM